MAQGTVKWFNRDLKPSNVLLSPVGPRVIDFGIARALCPLTSNLDQLPPKLDRLLSLCEQLTGDGPAHPPAPGRYRTHGRRARGAGAGTGAGTAPSWSTSRAMATRATTRSQKGA